MSLTDDLRSFVIPHRAHGTVTYTASAATEYGYDLRVRCTSDSIGQRVSQTADEEKAASPVLADHEEERMVGAEELPRALR